MMAPSATDGHVFSMAVPVVNGCACCELPKLSKFKKCVSEQHTLFKQCILLKLKKKCSKLTKSFNSIYFTVFS